MKILVPVDFRNASFSAYCYAATLAKSSHGSITLLHIISHKAKINEYVDDEMIEMLKDNSLQRLSHFATELPKIREVTCPEVELHYHVEYGDPGGAISQLAVIDEYDVVVMGIRDKLNFIERITGTTATYVMNHIKIPLILVHASSNSGPPQKAVFAFDHKSDLDDGVETYKKLNQELLVATDFVHILSDKDIDFPEITDEIIEELFDDDDPKFSFQIKLFRETDIVRGIYNYCLIENADMLIMIHRKNGILDLVLNNSQTIKAAYEFHLPLLVLPD